jgi:hypothetical protein
MQQAQPRNADHRPTKPSADGYYDEPSDIEGNDREMSDKNGLGDLAVGHGLSQRSKPVGYLYLKAAAFF